MILLMGSKDYLCAYRDFANAWGWLCMNNHFEMYEVQSLVHVSSFTPKGKKRYNIKFLGNTKDNSNDEILFLFGVKI